MLQFDSELEREDCGKKERAESLPFPEKMEQPLTWAPSSDNPWAERRTEEPFQGGLAKPLKKNLKGAVIKVYPNASPL